MSRPALVAILGSLCLSSCLEPPKPLPTPGAGAREEVAGGDEGEGEEREGEGEGEGEGDAAAEEQEERGELEDEGGEGEGGEGGEGEGEGEGEDEPAEGEAPVPRQAFFNFPRSDADEDHTLEDKVLDLVDRALPGSTIHVSLYGFARRRAAEAFVRAHQRGVAVSMVLDGGVASQAAWPLLQAGLPAASLTLCGSGEHSSCLGNGINHSKFYLLSALDDGSTDVVVQSSANLTREMLRQHNNLVVVRGDSSLYQGYLDVWHDQRAQVQDLDYYRTVVGDGPVRSYFFPRASGDTVVSVLNNVVCSAGSRVRVAMSLFTDSRIDIAAALAERAREGCDVQVLLKHNDTMPGAEVLSLLQESEVSLALLRASDARATVHSKVLLIDSAYDTGSGASWRRLVFTGSHNWTGPALRANDEQLMRIDDGEVFAAFEANLDAIAATAP